MANVAKSKRKFAKLNFLGMVEVKNAKKRRFYKKKREAATKVATSLLLFLII